MKFVSALLHFSVFWTQSKNQCLQNGTLTDNAEMNKALESIPEYIQKYAAMFGLDPLELPDITKTIKVPALIVSVSADLSLTNGSLAGASNIQSIDDIDFETDSNLIKTKFTIDFKELKFNYSFSVKLMSIKYSGILYGSIKKMKIGMTLVADISNITNVLFYLETLHVKKTGSLSVNLDVSPKIVDAFLNPVTNIASEAIKDVVMTVVEGKVKDMSNEILSKIHVGYG